MACRRRLWRSCAAQVYKRVPGGWASVGHKRLIFLDELAEIQPLVTAGGIGVQCSSRKGDLPTSPALEDLLNAGQGFGGSFKGLGVGQGNAASDSPMLYSCQAGLTDSNTQANVFA